MAPPTLVALLNLVVIDLVLSGDNAVVIALAVRRLEPAIARRAAVWGALIAVAMRVVFAALAAKLLVTPFVQAIGGVVLYVIAYNLLVPEDEAREFAEVAGFWGAVRVIVMADLIMSLDNILAVGGASRGNLALLIFGLGLSVPCVLFGAGLLAMLLRRFPALSFLGAAVLAWTAGLMISEDPVVRPHLASWPGGLVSGLIVVGMVAVLALGSARQRGRQVD